MERKYRLNKSDGEKLAETASEMQLEKLKLEIEQMKNKSKWYESLAPFTSLLSVIITVGGFLFGIIQFQKQQEKIRSEQEKQRIDEIQKRYEGSLGKLLQFMKDEKISVAEAGNFLVNLKTNIADKARIKPDDEELTPPQIKANEAELTRKVTGVLAYAIRYDCDFNDLRAVIFLKTIQNSWADYGEFLRENPVDNYFILNQHSDALRKIYEIDSAVIKNVTYNTDDKLYYYNSGYGKITPLQLNHFQLLMKNYIFAFQKITDEQRKQLEALKFQAAICNQSLTQQVLGTSFDSQNRAELKHCLEK